MHTALEVVSLVVALLSHGCPVQAIVFAFGLDERTVVKWFKRAGQQAAQGLFFAGLCAMAMAPLVLVGGLLFAVFGRRG